jgi:phosphoenolpyruvate carboxykinase (ATP)
MHNDGPFVSRHGIEALGLDRARTVYWNLPAARLYEEAVCRGEAMVSEHGPLVAETGPHTGRSPNDKFLVRDPTTRDEVWWGKVNRPIEAAQLDRLLGRLREYAEGRDLFVLDGYAGADPRYRLPVRVVTELAWHSLFAQNMFVRETGADALARFEPGFTVVDLPGCKADPAADGTASPTFIVLYLVR